MIEDHCCRVERATGGQAQQGSEVVDHRLEGTGSYPPPFLLVESLPWWKAVWQHPPKSARTHDPPQGACDLSKVVGALGLILAD
jgi:hypothetical protein